MSLRERAAAIAFAHDAAFVRNKAKYARFDPVKAQLIENVVEYNETFEATGINLRIQKARNTPPNEIRFLIFRPQETTTIKPEPPKHDSIEVKLTFNPKRNLNVFYYSENLVMGSETPKPHPAAQAITPLCTNVPVDEDVVNRFEEKVIDMLSEEEIAVLDLFFKQQEALEELQTQAPTLRPLAAE